MRGEGSVNQRGRGEDAVASRRRLDKWLSRRQKTKSLGGKPWAISWFPWPENNYQNKVGLQGTTACLYAAARWAGRHNWSETACKDCTSASVSTGGGAPSRAGCGIDAICFRKEGRALIPWAVPGAWHWWLSILTSIFQRCLEINLFFRCSDLFAHLLILSKFPSISSIYKAPATFAVASPRIIGFELACFVFLPTWSAINQYLSTVALN